jgi:hypothetical protein
VRSKGYSTSVVMSPAQLISEHAFLCTAHIVRRAGFRRDNAAQIVGMYVVSTYIFVEYPRLSLNLAHIDKTHSIRRVLDV